MPSPKENVSLARTFLPPDRRIGHRVASVKLSHLKQPDIDCQCPVVNFIFSSLLHQLIDQNARKMRSSLTSSCLSLLGLTAQTELPDPYRPPRPGGTGRFLGERKSAQAQ